MAREDWQGREEREARRRLRDDRRERDDFGQADYSETYAYDPRTRTGYRAEDDRTDFDDYGQADYSRDRFYGADERRDYGRRMDEGDYHREPRSWMGRAEAFFTGRPRRAETRPPRRRQGPSDRVLWAVIVERLEDERGLDLRDIDVLVEDAEVTLNGTVRHKADKRRVEDVADIDGVRHVQNNLRVRDRGHWTFF